MGRRYDHSRDDIRSMAIAAATQTVARDGLDAMTARRVADDIGYSPGTLYNLFENLDGLVLAVNAQTVDALHARLTTAVINQMPRDAVFALAQCYVEFCRENPRLWETLIQHRLPDGQLRPDWFRDKVDRLFGVIDQVFLDLMPHSPPANARRRARILWASVHGICSLTVIRDLDLFDGVSPEAMAKELVRQFVDGALTAHDRDDVTTGAA